MARTPARIALLALVFAVHSAPASARQTTFQPSPAEARTFATTNGGWSTSVDYNGLVCIPGVTCPAANPTYQTTGGAGGAGDGFLRDSFGTQLGVLSTTTILWTSPSFVAPSQVDVVRLALKVRPQIASLNAVGTVTIAPRLIDVADGTRSRALAPSTLTTASPSFQPMAVDFPAGWVVPGRTYRVAVDVSQTTAVSAVTSGTVDLDDAVLSLIDLEPPAGLSGSVPATGALRVTGAVDPAGMDTAVTVEYGSTAAYGSATTATTIPGSATGSQPFTVPVPTGGLTAGGTYHYRVKAENADGSITTADDTFIAPTPPSSAAPTVTGSARDRARTVTFARAADVTDAVVELLDGDDALLSSHPDDDGDGSVALTLPDADGDYGVRVRRTSDRALTTTSPVAGALLDRVGPATSSLELAVTPSLSAAAQRTAAFTRPVDAVTVTAQVIDADDTAVGAPVTVTGGSAAVTLGAADGDYRVRLTLTDATGNESVATSTAVTLDTAAPAAGPAPTVTGAGNVRARSVAFTRDAGTAAAVVELLDADDVEIDTVSMLSGATASLTLPDADGAYGVRVRQTDAAGNSATTPIAPVTLDRVAPDLSALALSVTPALSFATQRTVAFTRPSDATTVTAQAIDAGDTAVGAPVTVTGASATVSLGAADGDYRVVLSVADAAGNVARETSAAVTLDTAAPPAGPAPTVTGAGNVRARSLAFTRDPSATAVRVELLDADDVQVDTVSVPSGATASLTLPDADGAYAVRVRQTDAAGNSATTPVSEIVLDRAGPAVSGLALAVTPAVSSDAQRSVSFTRPSDATTVAAQVIDAADAAVGAPVTIAGASAAVTLGTADGDYRVRLTLADALGNESVATSTVVTLDTVRRTPPATGPEPRRPDLDPPVVPEQCTAPDAALALTGLKLHSGRVRVRGWAAAGPGTQVAIVDLKGKRVATATAGGGGVFTAAFDAPGIAAPRIAARSYVLAYRATTPGARSYAVMLRRANALTTVVRSGATVTLRGRVDLKRVGRVKVVEAFGGSGRCPRTDAGFAPIGRATVDRRTGAYTLRVAAPASGRLLVRTRVKGSRVVSRSAYVVR